MHLETTLYQEKFPKAHTSIIITLFFH